MQGNKCTCKTASRRDAWHLGMIDPAPSGVVYGWVACSECGNEWRTRAGYIRQIDGASQFRDTFRNEDATVMRYLTGEIKALDEQIGALQAKRGRLVKRYKKRQAGKK